MSGVAFVDTETTGLDPDRHEIWEVALIVDETEYVWQLPVDLGRADPLALKISGYYERHWREKAFGLPLSPPGVMCIDPARMRGFASDFAHYTRGRHLVGAVVSFDEERLRRLLKANGACPEWHYHLIDVEALAVGWVNGRRAGSMNQEVPGVPLPWKSDELSRRCGIEPPSEAERHTALGDARWARRLYEAICGGIS